jgi:molecular chaperone DnaK
VKARDLTEEPGTDDDLTGEPGMPGPNERPELPAGVAAEIRAAVHAELDEVVPYVVQALRRNDAFEAFEDRLKAAEKRIEARRERPLVIGLHQLLDQIRHFELEPAVKKALEDDVVRLLTEAGYQEFGHEGEAYDPARHDAIGGRAIAGSAVVTKVDTLGLTSFGDVVIRARVHVSPGRTSLLTGMTRSDAHMARIFGIDLGTTNSVIAYTDPSGTTEVIAGQDGNRIVPSVVYFGTDGVQLIGNEARSRAIIEPERVAMLFKRGMGEPTFLDNEMPFVVDGKTWSPEELSACVLRKLAQMAQDRFGEPVSKVVITVPAYFGDRERAATEAAGGIAGLEVVHIVNEPTAAAIAHGLDNPATGRILVFDLGGGTFDVTVMQVAADGAMQVLATGGDRRLGGMDFDNAILDRMIRTAGQGNLDIEEPWARQDAYGKAEALKKSLSSLETASTSLVGSGRPLSFELSRAQFERLIKDNITATEDTTLYTLDVAGLKPSAIGTVLMVGGSSRIPAFQQMLERIFGKPPVFSRNLDEDVARGAAMLAAKEGDDLDPRSKLAMIPKPGDVCAHGLGVSALDGDKVLRNSIIIDPQTPVPAKKEKLYSTVEEGQTEIQIDLNEGDEEDLDDVRRIGTGTARFGRSVRIDYPVRISVSYNRQGTIELFAYDGETDAKIGEMTVERPGLLNAAQQANARRELANWKVGG